MIIILGIVVGLLLLYLIRKAIHEYKEKKKIERWKSIWSSKRYSEFFKKVPSKNDLNRVVSAQRFLTAGFSMPVDKIYCLRLRERVAQFRTVEVDDILADNLIGRYVAGLRRDAKSYFELLQTDTPRQSFGKDGYHGHKNQHDYR